MEASAHESVAPTCSDESSSARALVAFAKSCML